MTVLPVELRNKLERTIIEARDVAEAGAKVALEAFAVHHHEPYGHMSPEERKLRNHLRARARQLGDKQNRNGELEITHLVWECAYEHWHRMLFARFLAENELLIEPDMGVAISLDECDELAKEDEKDLWTLASEFAQRMLPQIFRPNDPVLRVTFASEHRLKLEKLLGSLEPAVFTANDSLGWVYQFWQTKRKKKVNESGDKIGADELPAVTQLFTEPYMVAFLLDNSLGAWWAARRLTEDDLQNAENENELRKKVSLPGVPLEYMRFVKVAEASSLQKKEIGYFHKDEPITNLSGDLPHWRQEGVTYFVTFRTADSLPQEKLRQWQLEKERWLHDHPEPCDEKSKREFYEKFPERLQCWLDQEYGECVLQEQNCKKIVEGALLHFDGKRYDLNEFVIMPNHVHVLVTPKAGHELSKILHSWKSFTATEINKRTGKSGAFWQKESFDHIVRSPAQVERIRQYIKDHPAHGGRGFQPLETQRQDAAHGGRGFQPLETQRQDAAATIWTPAAGTFDGWPEHLSELKTLDPCCGSGHFLLAAFLMLVPMRMELESLSAREAVDAVLRENLHGLEIDNRCVELAAFALALAAWGYPDAGGYRLLPELNLACSGLAISAKKEEWLAMADDNTNLRMALEELYKQFKDAPVLGSLINPNIGLAKGSLFELKWEEVGPLLAKALSGEKDDEKNEMGVVARGVVKAAKLLINKYELVITNVPYLSRIKQTEELKKFCDTHYAEGKNDLANVFLERCLSFNPTRCVTQLVMPQNWLFLAKYKKQRESLLRQANFNLLARLGPGAFETISGEVVNVILFTTTKEKRKPASSFSGFDVSNTRSVSEKANALRDYRLNIINQEQQTRNPDSAIVLTENSIKGRIGDIADSYHGITTTDLPRFSRCVWENIRWSKDWILQQGTVGSSCLFGGKEAVLLWENGTGGIKQLRDAGATVVITGLDAWGRIGIVVNRMNLGVTLYLGDSFDTGVAVLVPRDKINLPALWSFCSSPDFAKTIKTFNDSMVVEYVYLPKVPFDLDHWTKVAEGKYPHGLPKPYSDDPTQWIFHGHPAKVADASSLWNQRQDAAATLQVAIARLLGYRWPAELDPKIELSDEQREWVKKCDGLIKYIDEDGIVCISSMRGEEPAADRLQEFLVAVYESGSGFQPLNNQRQDAAATILPATFQDWLNKLLAQANPTGETLDNWLRDHFFEQHCKLFHHLPFVWHIWDGRRRDGFHALVNYHKLVEGNGKGRQLLENLTYSYLGDWISRQKEGVRQGKGGTEDRLTAALELQKRLIAIIEGDPPFDIFVRWKPIEEQPIGWEPDINDGVRLNIRPFLAQDIPGGRKGAGILRWKPNINWNKDRGKEPFRSEEQYPWFWKDGEFTGDRVNEIHLTNEKKKQARERMKAEG